MEIVFFIISVIVTFLLIWGNVFAKIKQYGLNYEVLTVLKQNFNISKR
jgi:hypothetical protein